MITISSCRVVGSSAVNITLFSSAVSDPELRKVGTQEVLGRPVLLFPMIIPSKILWRKVLYLMKCLMCFVFYFKGWNLIYLFFPISWSTILLVVNSVFGRAVSLRDVLWSKFHSHTILHSRI